MLAGNESKIIAQVKAGDSKAFCELVEEYKGKALSVAYSFCANYEDAKALSQDAFITPSFVLYVPMMRADTQTLSVSVKMHPARPQPCSSLRGCCLADYQNAAASSFALLQNS